VAQAHALRVPAGGNVNTVEAGEWEAVMRLWSKAVVVAVAFGIGCICAVAEGAESAGDGKLKALIVDGENNHDWKSTTPVMKILLEDTGLFVVDVATTPQNGQPMDTFRPDFSKYNVVVSNYNGDADVEADWPKQTQDALVEYMENGGGLVIFHAADNAFPNWKEWNEMIGLGGWAGRDEKSGPMVRYRDGKVVLDNRPGPGGDHGPPHAFQVITREPEHPIMAGLPEKWMHARDELYSKLRGPAKNLTVLATAYADPEKGGTGEHEPILFTISYGKGRVFHTVLGHDEDAMECVGFIVTFQRGTEWAATGKVTQKVPADFPTAAEVSRRKGYKTAETLLGGCVLTSPIGEVPGDLYQMTDIVQTDEYKPFTKKLTVCGITLIGRNDISDEFMKKVATTIKSIFSLEGKNIDAELQVELLSNMYKYKTVIPMFKGREQRFSEADQALWDVTTSQNSICDIIMEGVSGQVNEVVEHILHWVSDVGLHYTFPDQWGISKTSKVYQAMQEAIDKGHYDVTQYGDASEEELTRVLIQEFGYWVIFTAWDLLEPFGPEAEWKMVKNPSELREKLPKSYELFEQTIPKVMVAPSRAMLKEFFVE